MSEVCAAFEISRQTGYKWLSRHQAEGLEGLKERSRAPLMHGKARDQAIVEAALTLRELEHRTLRLNQGGIPARRGS